MRVLVNKQKHFFDNIFKLKKYLLDLCRLIHITTNFPYFDAYYRLGKVKGRLEVVLEPPAGARNRTTPLLSYLLTKILWGCFHWLENENIESAYQRLRVTGILLRT